MEIFRFNILPLSEIEKREAFKEAVNNCPICGHKLSFQHDNDFMTNTLKEEAHCAACAVDIRSETHTVQ